jgi:azurin
MFLSKLLLAALLPTMAFAAEVPLTISTVGNELSYDKKVLQVKPGQAVSLTFHNSADVGSGMQHTWTLVKPGTEEQIATEAVEAGAAKNYVPNDPSVLASTKLVEAGKSETIHFKAPTQPGSYPYICTFPAHFRVLKGVLQVG